MNILQLIFKDNFHNLKAENIKIRDVVYENVEKMIHCGDYSYGCAVYGCEHCGQIKTVPFRCKSRFCTSCGTLYSIKRATEMSLKLIDVPHRHCVFTIDDTLRKYFLADRSLLNCLFSAVRSVVLRMFHKDNMSMKFTPGFICVLHTFGRDLKWNPHIHCLISEFGVADSGTFRKKAHFNYTFLRNAFQTVLLNLLEERIGKSFKLIKAASYKKHDNGFYVYAKPNKCNHDQVVKYIGRYLGRPFIASSRIDKYDGDFVTFHYNRHEDDKLIYETIPVLDFIKKLIRHIPEKHFKMVRYYGIYARHRQSDKKIRRMISSEKRSFYRSLNSWRNSIFFSFGYDPLKCHNCGKLMTLLDIFRNFSRVPLDESFRMALEKYHYSSLSSF